jgi:site-specific recombinase XerD
MQQVLNNQQMEKLHGVLMLYLLSENNPGQSEISDEDTIDMFVSAKQVEGCSPRTIKYYRTTLLKVLGSIEKPVRQIETEDVRSYLSDYQEKNKVSKVTINNVCRILSSFFGWLEAEDQILKSPMRRIHKVKVVKTVKETYTDETIEKMRDNCDNIRNLAIIDMLNSTGIRVGELVKLNIHDIDFENRECVVFGKGDKERPVYFDAKTKIHLQNYLKTRNDDNSALFVSLLKPYKRLQISGVEVMLKKIGEGLNLGRTYPHKFRRTLATRAIDKGCP